VTKKIVVTEYVSIDGVIEDPVGMENSGLGNWTGPFSRGPEGDKFKLEELQAADSLIFGRVTYEAFAAVWPHMKDETGMAARMNTLPKIVASRTLKNPDWGDTTVWNGDIVGQEVSRAGRWHGLDLRQRVGRASARACRANRRVSSHGLSDDPRSREAPLSGRREVHSGAGGEPAVRRRHRAAAVQTILTEVSLFAHRSERLPLA
jgi:hypothetical protein